MYLIWSDLDSGLSLQELSDRIEQAKKLGCDTIIPQNKFSCGEIITDLVAIKKPTDEIQK